ncbi:MAG: hypothetical protein IPK82_37325 [Polyangiaceae bacterium]|nr:hypothetical protein [Polyangiaceae bacterium]
MRLMLFGWAVTGALCLGACASGGREDPCERAIERLVAECGYDATVSGDLNCTGQSACIAICLEQSPCEDIAANDGEFAACVAKCE